MIFDPDDSGAVPGIAGGRFGGRVWLVDDEPRLRSRGLRRLAGDWGMNFSLADRLRLTSKVARSFPVPGAANLRVTNVVYGTDHDRYRYIFTAEYTVGVGGLRRRIIRAGSFSEPRDRESPEGSSDVALAPGGCSLIDQYRAARAATDEPAIPTSQIDESQTDSALRSTYGTTDRPD